MYLDTRIRIQRLLFQAPAKYKNCIIWSSANISEKIRTTKKEKDSGRADLESKRVSWQESRSILVYVVTRSSEGGRGRSAVVGVVGTCRS